MGKDPKREKTRNFDSKAKLSNLLLSNRRLKKKLKKKEKALKKKEKALKEKEKALKEKEKQLILKTIGDKWNNFQFLKNYCLLEHGRRIKTLHEAWKCIFPHLYEWIKSEKESLIIGPKETLNLIVEKKQLQMYRSTSCLDIEDFSIVVNRAMRYKCMVDVYFELFNIKKLVKENQVYREKKKINALLALHKGSVADNLNHHEIDIIASYLGLKFTSL